MRRSAVPFLLVSVVTLVLASGGPISADPNATITGSFSDSCRDFEAHSSKDISHVEIHYADGRVVKDETINSPDYSIDGGPGEEIGWTNVKSGLTTNRFECVPETNDPPAALLEAKTGPMHESPGEWTSQDGTLRHDENGEAIWEGASGWNSAECDRNNKPDDHSDPVPLRGINSSDPEGDIVNWSIDFGDGTSTGTRSWMDDPPVEVTHTYDRGSLQNEGGYRAVLTVIDSAGNVGSDSLTLLVAFCGDVD